MFTQSAGVKSTDALKRKKFYLELRTHEHTHTKNFEHRCPQTSKTLESLGVGVIGGCEPTDVGTRDQTQVL